MESMVAVVKKQSAALEQISQIATKALYDGDGCDMTSALLAIETLALENK
jgi:hypothetical protein